jgi:hypothetical protein
VSVVWSVPHSKGGSPSSKIELATYSQASKRDKHIKDSTSRFKETCVTGCRARDLPHQRLCPLISGWVRDPWPQIVSEVEHRKSHPRPSEFRPDVEMFMIFLSVFTDSLISHPCFSQSSAEIFQEAQSWEMAFGPPALGREPR